MVSLLMCSSVQASGGGKARAKRTKGGKKMKSLESESGDSSGDSSDDDKVRKHLKRLPPT